MYNTIASGAEASTVVTVPIGFVVNIPWFQYRISTTTTPCNFPQPGVHETSIHGQLYDDKCAEWRQISQQLRTKATQNVREARIALRRRPDDLATRQRLSEALRCRSTLHILLGVLEIEIDLIIMRDDADEFVAKFERRLQFVQEHFSARLAQWPRTPARTKRSLSLPSNKTSPVTRVASRSSSTLARKVDGQSSIRLMNPADFTAKRSLLTAKLQRLYQDSALSDLRPLTARAIRQSEYHLFKDKHLL